MSVLKVWSLRNRRKSFTGLLIALMLLSILPIGVLSAQVVNANINPATAEYNLTAPTDVSTIIAWNDATSVVSVVYDGTPLAEAVYGTVYIDSTTSTLTIRNNFFASLTPAMVAGAVLPFTVNFKAGDPVTSTVTVINTAPLLGIGTITGKVTDPDGNGVPNARVNIWDQATDAWVGGAQTDVNGNYTIAGLAPGTRTVWVSPPSGVNLLLPASISGIVVADGVTTTVNVYLVVGGIIAGRVTDPNGVGVPNARVDIWIPAIGVIGMAHTDANGNYTIVGLASRIYEIEVRPPRGVNLLPARISGIVVATGTTTSVNVSLVVGGIIAGRVIGPDGVGVPNASIYKRVQATGTWVHGVRTDANGNYTIAGLAPGTYEMSVRPPWRVNLLPVRISDIVVAAGATTTVDVSLNP